MLRQFVAHGITGLGQGHSLQEDFGRTGRLDGTIRTNPLVHFGLGGAENGDMDLVTLAQDIGIGSLRAVRRAENLQRAARKQGMSINVSSGLLCCFRYRRFTRSLGFGSRFISSCRRHFGLIRGHFGSRDHRGNGRTTRLGSSFTNSSSIARLFGLHLVQDSRYTALIGRILLRRNVVHIDSVLQQTGTDLRFVQAAFLQFCLGHRHQVGGLGHYRTRQRRQRDNRQEENNCDFSHILITVFYDLSLFRQFNLQKYEEISE